MCVGVTTVCVRACTGGMGKAVMCVRVCRGVCVWVCIDGAGKAAVCVRDSACRCAQVVRV